MFGTDKRKPRYMYRAAVQFAVEADQAARIMGSNLQCRGIHLPPNPQPHNLGRAARKLYDLAYANALEFYSVPGNEDPAELARHTAWKTVRLFYLDPLSQRPQLTPALPEPGKEPSTFIGEPKAFVKLGYLLEYTVIDGDANLHRYSFQDDPPALYWSERLKSLFVLPGAQVGDVCRIPPKKGPLVSMFRTWAQRRPKCETDVEVPEVDVRLQGWIDTLVYRSDKWHDPNPRKAMVGSQPYIHQHGDGVGVWASAASGDNPPAAIVVTGGCLDVMSRGIIH